VREVEQEPYQRSSVFVVAILLEDFLWVSAGCPQAVQNRGVVRPSILVEDRLSSLEVALAFLQEEAQRQVSAADFYSYLQVDHQACQL
jgi:hypothetical protein